MDPASKARDSAGAIGSPLIQVPLVDPTSSICRCGLVAFASPRPHVAQDSQDNARPHEIQKNGPAGQDGSVCARR